MAGKNVIFESKKPKSDRLLGQIQNRARKQKADGVLNALGLSLMGVLQSGFADLGFHFAIVEAGGEFVGLHRVYCGAEDLSVFIHGDGVAACQGGGGVQGAQHGGVLCEG